MMKVVWREQRADGSTSVTLKNYQTGEERALSDNYTPCETGPLQSVSCGVTVNQLERAKKVDCALGISDEYHVDGPVAYKTFNSPSEKRKWLKAHRWVDHNAGYGDPCPGDFGGDKAPPPVHGPRIRG